VAVAAVAAAMRRRKRKKKSIDMLRSSNSKCNN
jgi:hypothetical protein